MSTLEVKAIQAPTGYKLAMPAGHIIQTVNSVIDTFNTTTSSSFVASDITASITPSSASSKILVRMNVYMVGSQGAFNIGRLYRGIGGSFSEITGANATHSVSVHGTGNSGFITSVYNPQDTHHNHFYTTESGEYLDSPNTTSAVTYTLYYKARAGNTAYINRSSGGTGSDHHSHGISSVTLMEVAG
tara:strand:- start:20 stop:580 length:561 start_codon:yes stop_codon:yes gene_type:complete